MLLKLKQFFQSKTTGITAAAILIAVFSLLSRLLGIFRDRVLAGQFDAGEVLDAYYSAFRIPDLIYNLLILGAFSAGLIPVFSSLIKQMKDDGRFHFSIRRPENQVAWDLISNLLNVLIIVFMICSLLGIVFAPQLIALITPGFSPELRVTTVTLTRIMFFSPLFLGISSLLGGVLQSFKNFFVFSLAPIFYNLGIIAGALLLVPRLGISGLAWGVVLGAFLHMIIQIPAVRSLGWRWRLFFIDFKNKDFRRIVGMMIPRTLSLAIVQINLLVITIIASTLDSGSLTVFNLANNLQSFPIGIFGISFAVAAFPVLSQVAFDQKKLVDSFSYALRQIWFFIIPATVLLLTLRAQIIRVILGSGEFSWDSTVLTINTLGFFALSLFAQAAIPLLTRVFYARCNSKTPFFIGLVSVLVNIFLSLFFGRRMGVAGLALAFSLSSILNFMILWMWLYFEIGGLDQKRIVLSVLKFSAAGLLAGFFVQLGKIIIWPVIDMTKFWGVLSQGLFAGLLGLMVYCLACYLMKSQEMLEIIGVIKRKLPFSRRLKKDQNLDDQSEARGL